jgi:hypothetical protein
MPYSKTGYQSRAEECVRLANATKDEMLRSAILGLRQQYLVIARRLGELGEPLHSGAQKDDRGTAPSSG